MVDKKLEENIKKTKEFMEIWNNFHRIFKNAISRNTVNKGEEKHFLSTKELVNSRYDDLMDSLGVKPIKRFITGEPVYNILSLENLSIMSDERLAALDGNWKHSFELLRVVLSRLERKKRRLRGFSKFAFTLKKGMSKFR